MRGQAGLCVGLVVLASAGCGASEDSRSGPGDDAGADVGADGGDGFEPYFDGKSIDGFDFVGISASDVSVEGETLKCKCQANGYMYRNETFRNFVMRLEFRFERPADLAAGADATFFGNSGTFVYLAPPHQIWPKCLEVQGAYQETGDIFGLPGLLPGNDAPDLAKLALARKPVGEWNDLQISSNEGALRVELNGVLVNESTAGELREGLIALESEGAETHFRSVRIKRLP